jgi:hypothetical protein
LFDNSLFARISVNVASSTAASEKDKDEGNERPVALGPKTVITERPICISPCAMSILQ